MPAVKARLSRKRLDLTSTAWPDRSRAISTSAVATRQMGPTTSGPRTVGSLQPTVGPRVSPSSGAIPQTAKKSGSIRSPSLSSLKGTSRQRPCCAIRARSPGDRYPLRSSSRTDPADYASGTGATPGGVNPMIWP